MRVPVNSLAKRIYAAPTPTIDAHSFAVCFGIRLLEIEIAKLRVIIWPSPQWPTKEPVGTTDRMIVEICHASPYQPIRIDFPMFVSVRPDPIPVLVVIFARIP